MEVERLALGARLVLLCTAVRFMMIANSAITNDVTVIHHYFRSVLSANCQISRDVDVREYSLRLGYYLEMGKS